MGKYLKKFDTHTEYETYINGSDKVLPNVSLCATENEVHYNPIVPMPAIGGAMRHTQYNTKYMVEEKSGKLVVVSGLPTSPATCKLAQGDEKVTLEYMSSNPYAQEWGFIMIDAVGNTFTVGEIQYEYNEINGITPIPHDYE